MRELEVIPFGQMGAGGQMQSALNYHPPATADFSNKPWASVPTTVQPNREMGVCTLEPLTSPGTYDTGLEQWAYSWYAAPRDMAFRCFICGKLKLL